MQRTRPSFMSNNSKPDLKPVLCSRANCAVNVRDDRTFRDVHGNAWCAEHRVRGMLINWAAEHKYPRLDFVDRIRRCIGLRNVRPDENKVRWTVDMALASYSKTLRSLLYCHQRPPWRTTRRRSKLTRRVCIGTP